MIESLTGRPANEDTHHGATTTSTIAASHIANHVEILHLHIAQQINFQHVPLHLSVIRTLLNQVGEESGQPAGDTVQDQGLLERKGPEIAAPTCPVVSLTTIAETVQ
jgi:hypothetical protein